MSSHDVAVLVIANAYTTVMLLELRRLFALPMLESGRHTPEAESAMRGVVVGVFAFFWPVTWGTALAFGLYDRVRSRIGGRK